MSGTDLYMLLTREFKRRQHARCEQCYVQLPYRVGRSDPSAPNWELVLPPECMAECRSVMEELVAELSERYDLDAS